MYHLCVKTKHFASHGTSWVFSGPLERKKTQFLARHWPLCLFWTSAFLNRFQWFRIKQKSHWNTFVISTWHQKKLISCLLSQSLSQPKQTTEPPRPCFSSTKKKMMDFNDCLYRFFTFILKMVDGLLGNGFTFVQNLAGVLIFCKAHIFQKKKQPPKKQKHMWRAGNSCYHPKGILSKSVLIFCQKCLEE